MLPMTRQKNGATCLWVARSVKKQTKKQQQHTQYLNLGAYHLQINIANIDTYATIVKLEKGNYTHELN